MLALLAAVIASTAHASWVVHDGQSGTCSGLMTKAKSSRHTLVPGAPVKITVTVKNAGGTTLDGVGVRLSSSVVGDWKAKKAGATVEGGLVLWSNYQLGPRKRLTFRVRGRACAGLEAGTGDAGGSFRFPGRHGRQRHLRDHHQSPDGSLNLRDEN